MKVIVFGASGVIGQHMRLCVPAGIEPVWARRQVDLMHMGVDLTDRKAREQFLRSVGPSVIVNLAGESSPDVVERDPERYRDLNMAVPGELARWCDEHDVHFIQVSTQAVFSGEAPPYGPWSDTKPVNMYGRQKASAEHRVRQARNWTIVRPTFVLGVRPFQFLGRENPIEQMLGNKVQRQVGDRWFSVSMAQDVAMILWSAARQPDQHRAKTVHVGSPLRLSRYELASMVAEGVEKVSHDSFPGLAPRPLDTTYVSDAESSADIQAELLRSELYRLSVEFAGRKNLTLAARAREIALFLGEREDDCEAALSKGFAELHNAVTYDFKKFGIRNDWDLLKWYGRTLAYIWELSAYHADAGFNYSGQCQGIAEALKAHGVKRVLCLGDGIGDLTLTLIRAGFDAHYHDLEGSRTAEFALFRSWMYLGKYFPTCMTRNWEPEIGAGEWDAVVSLDFLEHVTDVDKWVSAIQKSLKPGGLFCAQNAFACGSGPDGPMPMHLARNDRFEKDWDPTLFSLGFNQLSSNWYRAPVEVREPVAA